MAIFSLAKTMRRQRPGRGSGEAAAQRGHVSVAELARDERELLPGRGQDGAVGEHGLVGFGVAVGGSAVPHWGVVGGSRGWWPQKGDGSRAALLGVSLSSLK